MPLYHMFPLLYSVVSIAVVIGQTIVQLDSAGPSPFKVESSATQGTNAPLSSAQQTSSSNSWTCERYSFYTNHYHMFCHCDYVNIFNRNYADISNCDVFPFCVGSLPQQLLLLSHLQCHLSQGPQGTEHRR